METGRIETDVRNHYADFKLDFIPDLIAAKKEEKIELDGLDWSFHSKQLESLEAKLDEAFAKSKLPESRDTEAVNDLLVELRLEGV